MTLREHLIAIGAITKAPKVREIAESERTPVLKLDDAARRVAALVLAGKAVYQHEAPPDWGQPR